MYLGMLCNGMSTEQRSQAVGSRLRLPPMGSIITQCLVSPGLPVMWRGSYCCLFICLRQAYGLWSKIPWSHVSFAAPHFLIVHPHGTSTDVINLLGFLHLLAKSLHFPR